MHKFDLTARSARPATGLELELIQEQSEALGAAGKKLQASIDMFNASVERNAAPAERDALLGEIGSRAWALMVQRELVGFKHETLQWVLDRFEIPDGALGRPGRTDAT